MQLTSYSCTCFRGGIVIFVIKNNKCICPICDVFYNETVTYKTSGQVVLSEIEYRELSQPWCPGSSSLIQRVLKLGYQSSATDAEASLGDVTCNTLTRSFLLVKKKL